MRATVDAILTNSPMKNVIGLAPPGFLALAYNRAANKALGTAQHKPPNNADIPEAVPAISAATSATTNVATNCSKTIRAMPIPRNLSAVSNKIYSLPNDLSQRKRLPTKTTELYVVVRTIVKRLMRRIKMRHTSIFCARYQLGKPMLALLPVA